MRTIRECRLYGIIDTGYVSTDRIGTVAKALVQGGVDILQLRAKRESPEEIVRIAGMISPFCRKAGIPFLLNDHPGLVRETGADGAHVGQEDMTVAEARELAGDGALIGRSTHSLRQALETAAERPDYIGFGPLFATPTKPDYLPVGTGEIREVQERANVPVFCIGGIREDNLGEVLSAGALRVVIVSDLLLAPDPASKTASCRRRLAA